MRHANVSIFVPNSGCKNRCSFCNQFCITGQLGQPNTDDVKNAAEIALASLGASAKDAEIAFFGGSFTAIDPEYMRLLLETAYHYVKDGRFRGIRISTRPDAIDSDILNMLRRYGVTAIELGAQSMCDDVLNANLRGHTAAQVESAAQMIKESGFSLGLQMMTGLLCDSEEKDEYTARRIASLCPDTVRIYPTIVLKNTMLEKLYINQKYCAQTLDQAVGLCAKLLLIFRDAGIPVIRMGLHSIDQSEYVAGPWHPAFRELCEGEIYFELMLKRLEQLEKHRKYIIYVNQSAVSKAVGQKRINLKRLADAGYLCKIKINNDLSDFELKTEGCEDDCF